MDQISHSNLLTLLGVWALGHLPPLSPYISNSLKTTVNPQVLETWKKIYGSWFAKYGSGKVLKRSDKSLYVLKIKINKIPQMLLIIILMLDLRYCHPVFVIDITSK